MIYREQFFKLKSFLQFYSLTNDQLIELWVKIIDPNFVKEIPWHKMFEVIEILSRGLTNNESSVISQQFTNNFMKLLDFEGCLIYNENSFQ